MIDFLYHSGLTANVPSVEEFFLNNLAKLALLLHSHPVKTHYRVSFLFFFFALNLKFSTYLLVLIRNAIGK